MPDLTVPLTVASVFTGIGWLIVHAHREYADVIRHSLIVILLSLGLLVVGAVTEKLPEGPVLHQVEGRPQAVRPAPKARAAP